MLAATLVSHHNLAFFMETMRQVREAIKEGRYGGFRAEFLAKLKENAGLDV